VLFRHVIDEPDVRVESVSEDDHNDALCWLDLRLAETDSYVAESA
jgi:hypothetical protein